MRAKTNTYIKTPVRNEEPVFVVTGRKEDVAKAKREILSAAEHFTLIRATRRTNDGINGCAANITSGGGGGHLISLNKNSLSSTTPLPGQVTIQVRVPYRVVGLVVGPKGNTIKHIQHETQTYIVTPSRDKEPIFEVTGMPDNVQMARKQIEAHIATRTGNSLNNALAIPAPPPPPPPPPAPAGTINRLNEALNSTQNTSTTTSFHSINALNQILNDDLHSEILSSIYKNGIGSALEYSEIGGNVISAASKCNTSNSFNGFMNCEINPSTISLNEIQRRVVHNSGNNNASNFDFINSLMDSNTAHFINEQNTNFPQLSNSATAVRNLKSVINTINILENSSNGAGSLLHQPNSLSTNALLTRSCSSASSTASSSKSFCNNGNSKNNPFWKSFNGGSSVSAVNGSCNGVGSVNNDCIDVDEGIGESPLYSWGLPNTLAALTNSYCSPASTSISPTDSLFGEHVHTNAATSILQQQHQNKSSSKTKILDKVKRSNCWMCQEKDIFAALLPCGHKMFCYDCANRLCQQNESTCPICSTQIYQAVKIQN